MTDVDSLIRAADPAAGLTAPAPPPFREPARREARWLPAVAAAAAVAAVVGLAVATTGSGGGAPVAGPDPTGTPAAADPAPTIPDWTGLTGALVRDLPRDLGTLTVGKPTTPQALPGTTVSGALVEVHVGARIGTVTATVWAGIPLGDPCRISARVKMDGNCRLVRTAGGQTVAVTDPNPVFGWPGITDSWALYQAPDGVVVLIAQGVGIEQGGRPRLERLPWSPERLAEVAADPAFRR